MPPKPKGGHQGPRMTSSKRNLYLKAMKRSRTVHGSLCDLKCHSSSDCAPLHHARSLVDCLETCSGPLSPSLALPRGKRAKSNNAIATLHRRTPPMTILMEKKDPIETDAHFTPAPLSLLPLLSSSFFSPDALSTHGQHQANPGQKTEVSLHKLLAISLLCLLGCPCRATSAFDMRH